MSFPKIDGYVVTEKLGSGSYSTVYKAYTKIGARTTVAVKCIDKSRIKHSGAAVVNLVTEIRLLKSLTHPHIVHMKEFTWDDRNIYIIMEYCCGGDLSKYIRRYGRVPEKQVSAVLLATVGVSFEVSERQRRGAHGPEAAQPAAAQGLRRQAHAQGGGLRVRAAHGGAARAHRARLPAVHGARDVAGRVRRQGRSVERGLPPWVPGVIMYECLFGRAPYSSATFAELMDKIQRQAPIEAVALIKRAIELECSGRLAEALQAYGDSLLYLVPAVGAESDAVRRSALAAKLRQYMDRAEEIKRIVTGQASVPSAAPPSHDSVVHSPQACDTTVHCTHNEDIQTDKTDVDIQTDKNTSEPAAKAQDRRGALARLLRRPVPYLDRDTSEGVPEKPQKNNEANDTCKIT
ncbi:serine/threonine-protein kinase ULK3 isoform X3 [Bicyclus anynana]|uniref:non-specific serine/threonine protein kinase n=1 Tax=Bicyclus anynana TaxID=110368 RepID=A0ABM3M4L0_BICAN|nr:serine/threonine-protein kinase ULK3 isoform X3 [Bicyclus anynana]